MKQKLKRIAIAMLCASLLLSGCGSTGKVKRTAARMMEEDPSLTKEEALNIAQAKVDEENDIRRRLKAGELVDGYNGYYECRAVVKNAGWNSGFFQIADMVFNLNYTMTPEDVKGVVEASNCSLVVVDDFFGGYPCIKAEDSKGNSMIYFNWAVVGENEWPGRDPGCYLCGAAPANNDKVPWDRCSVYLPGGFQYYFSEYKNGDGEEKYKTMTREALLSYLTESGFYEGYSYNFGRPGSFYSYGEEKVTVKYAIPTLEDEVRFNKYDQMEEVVAYRKYTYIFDTDGNLAEIDDEGSDFSWISADYWFEEE